MKKIFSKSALLIYLINFIFLSCQSSKIVSTSNNSKEISYSSQIKLFQEEMNSSYKDIKESPLESKERKKFKSLPFFEMILYIK